MLNNLKFYRTIELIKDDNFRKRYSEWEELYYHTILGQLRNIILNEEKTEMLGYYHLIDKWGSGKKSVEREIMFKNNRPYMLYPLQYYYNNDYRWYNCITVSTGTNLTLKLNNINTPNLN